MTKWDSADLCEWCLHLLERNTFATVIGIDQINVVLVARWPANLLLSFSISEWNSLRVKCWEFVCWVWDTRKGVVGEGSLKYKYWGEEFKRRLRELLAMPSPHLKLIIFVIVLSVCSVLWFSLPGLSCISLSWMR